MKIVLSYVRKTLKQYSNIFDVRTVLYYAVHTLVRDVI